MTAPDVAAGLVLIGRSSSSFTRITRVFAAELGVPYTLRVVPNLLSLDASDYGGHPSLKLPVLQTNGESWFGSLSICRELARRASTPRRIVWPEACDRPLTANAQELTLVALSSAVSYILSTIGNAEGPHVTKLRESLGNTLAWLDHHIDAVVAALPADRDLSYLEVALFCLVAHLDFREVVPSAPYVALRAFTQKFGERASARATPYQFDR